MVIPVLQVIGYQDSGKTTVMKQLIKAAESKGILTGTIKHHGHGGLPEQPSGKDSRVHLEAGASVSTVEGEGAVVLQSVSGVLSLESLLDFYRKLPIHVILIEGYKKEHFPKIAVIRDARDLSLIDTCTNVQLVISAAPLTGLTLPNLLFEDQSGYIKWFLNWLKEESACLS
ncbi:molybdopterin-guanine dinucleotide biosynthesis protein B [Jeotgalibacillus sp. R-1-5s-1]|uniref:molybdopterin-guanine dinucleotide biosynthesis protein B n=1 Tax=Jeotgalibacillus sp. R-1-5s-1 TaxID=2555897 RepID=UPI00106D7219|nr:molybdopterin-guanine dinucleotide biosynthesis protein B [Jeotgalibacillus sp. R-1-5s-1]TFE01852.1 molybdopterin-guanine dinucleotide biosynthesis protein B [Jeotgalibacillus sp. R-1-5s-1]